MKIESKFINHPYHIVNNSPWPFVIGMSIFCIMLLNGIMLSYGITNFNLFFLFRWIYRLSLFIFIISICLWWYDMINESVVDGNYTSKVQLNLSIGMILFIISEVMFFFGFFWAYFHFSLNSSDSLQGHWPLMSIDVITAFGLPLVNTFILLTSGITLTYSHYALFNNNKLESVIGLCLIVFLGLIFLKNINFYLVNFTIFDSGSIFYLLKGQGFNLLIVIIFLIVIFIRMFMNHYFQKFFFYFLEFIIYYLYYLNLILQKIKLIKFYYLMNINKIKKKNKLILNFFYINRTQINILILFFFLILYFFSIISLKIIIGNFLLYRIFNVKNYILDKSFLIIYYIFLILIFIYLNINLLIWFYFLKKYNILYIILFIVYLNFIKNLYLKKQYKKLIFTFFIKFIYLFGYCISDTKLFNNPLNYYFIKILNFLFQFINMSLECETSTKSKILIGFGFGFTILGLSFYGLKYYQNYQLKYNNERYFIIKKNLQDNFNLILSRVEKDYKLKIEILEKEKQDLILINNNFKFDLENVSNNLNLKNIDNIELNQKFTSFTEEYNKFVTQYVTNMEIYKENEKHYLEVIEENKNLFLNLQNKYNLLSDTHKKLIKKYNEATDYLELVVKKGKEIKKELLEFQKLQLTPDQIKMVNEQLEVSNHKIYLLEIEKKRIQNLSESCLIELDFFKSIIFKINRNLVDQLSPNKSLGIIYNNFNDNKCTIYSLIPNHFLENFNLKKITIVDILYHRNWNITCYFFKSLSTEIISTISDSLEILPYTLVESIEDYSVIRLDNFLDYVNKKEMMDTNLKTELDINKK
jgi:cytochrome c oxidase subunit 3